MCVNVITRSGLFNTVLTVVSLMFSLGVQLVSENLFIKKKTVLYLIKQGGQNNPSL